MAALVHMSLVRPSLNKFLLLMMASLTRGGIRGKITRGLLDAARRRLLWPAAE